MSRLCIFFRAQGPFESVGDQDYAVQHESKPVQSLKASFVLKTNPDLLEKSGGTPQRWLLYLVLVRWFFPVRCFASVSDLASFSSFNNEMLNPSQAEAFSRIPHDIAYMLNIPGLITDL
jgi:hypothetical protein